MTAQLQAQQSTKPGKRVPLRWMAAMTKGQAPEDAHHVMEAACCTRLPLPSSPLQERAPQGPGLSTSHAEGKAVSLLLYPAFLEACSYSQLGTRECLCTQAPA